MRFVHVTAPELRPYVASLRALEASIQYPIADGADSFTIDHGPDYHPFFSRLGEAHFLLALEGDEVVGSIAAVLRNVSVGDRAIASIYLCDLKLAAALRGRGVARRMLRRGLIEIAKHPRGRRARLIYGAAMVGAQGDVMRSARGANPLRLAGPIAALRLYFVAPERLAMLEGAGPIWPGGERLAASEAAGQLDDMVETTGAKDLRLRSSGAAWPLVHLTRAPWHTEPSWGEWLRGCGERLAGRAAGTLACFALDQRLVEHHAWLARAGIDPGARCILHGLAATRVVRSTRVAHLATSEI
ncbi:GNAT family N-acetyltransferase [Nannocystaceae bacterium ST9]